MGGVEGPTGGRSNAPLTYRAHPQRPLRSTGPPKGKPARITGRKGLAHPQQGKTFQKACIAKPAHIKRVEAKFIQQCRHARFRVCVFPGKALHWGGA